MTFLLHLMILLYNGNFLKIGNWARQPTQSAIPFSMGKYMKISTFFGKNFDFFYPSTKFGFPLSNLVCECIFFLSFPKVTQICTTTSKPLKQYILALWASMALNQFVSEKLLTASHPKLTKGWAILSLILVLTPVCHS